MNLNQKKIILYAVVISIFAFAMWAVYGFHPLTLFAGPFIWGLDLTLLICSISLIGGGILFKKRAA